VGTRWGTSGERPPEVWGGVTSLVLFRRVLGGALLGSFALASACTLLLDGAPALGNACRFEGELTTCGRCLREACEEEIDACCGGRCGDALERLDACAAQGDFEACADLKTDEDEDSGELSRCVVDRCDSACPSAPSITLCDEVEYGCVCSPDRDEANDVPCDVSAVSVRAGTCCADPGWPASGECKCTEVGCDNEADSCTCSPISISSRRTDSDEIRCDDQGFAFCCITYSGCTCRSDAPCAVDARGCSPDDYPCPDGTVQVDRCSATEDDL
jgi:hypothetical protein